VLDVLLDVDNYLREHPVDDNPRARIVSRYISMLRHLCRWRDAEGRSYGALVIVSHSQGTVITGDLLRYLSGHPGADPDLQCLGDDLKVRVLTMGSPLRQLYGRRFPHLYAWAYHDGSAFTTSGRIPQQRPPDPARMGVETWINLFRSGDYIGRHLWLADNDAALFTCPPPASPMTFTATSETNGACREVCIGSGAHTHYWDGALPVARAIDEAIR
jgi:hypothetical protein